MGGDSAQAEEVEKSGDLKSPSGVAEQEQQMRSSDTGVEATGPFKDQTNERREVEDDASELAGSSTGSEQVQEVGLFSPGFSTAAAKAGWDAEALLMAALCRSPMDSECRPEVLPASQSSHVDARKRDKRTPLSSARRHRRVRLEDKNGSPLGRLPMKPLTHLSDSELENIAPTNQNCPIPVAEGKDNFDNNSVPSKGDHDLKGKEKERTPTKPFCMDQLREELSCAVCLDICFEPSTISCGHSFCGTCLQSVLQKCGPRCPKCRQPLRSEALRSCKINTVLWNTIQILFPKESAARLQDKNESLAKEAAHKPSPEEIPFGRYLGTRPSRMQPWRSSALNNVSRTSFMENLRTSFQAASESMMPISMERDNNDRAGHYDPPTLIVNREDRDRMGRSQSSHSSRSRRQTQVQEQVDAALAARLQQAELNAASDTEDLFIIEGPREDPREGSRIRGNPTTMVPRSGTVASAAVNLRTVAQRASRQRRTRTRS
ncbi:unnamed protein product [Calypogeia fissa]